MKYYCLGIKGAGMSTLACILHDLGNEVIGYDDVVDYKFTQEGLEKRGIKIYHDQEHVLDKDFIVTHSVALKSDHKELVRAVDCGLKLVKYNEILGHLTSIFNSICVSGTHGKTTTSSLITHILNNIFKVNYFIGDGTGHAEKDNDIFVIESDEFNRHFLAYEPSYTIITNIELEHTEIYRDIEDIIETFEKFANKTKNTVIAYGDNSNIRKINFSSKVLYYGLDESNDVYAKNVVLNETGSSFDVYMNKEFFGHFELPLFGMHMVLNCLACIVVCSMQGVSVEVMNELLKTFKNAKRRFALEEVGSNVIVDDYAHHPTEITATANAIKNKQYNQSWCVFQPHTYSRTKNLFDDFITALSNFDNIIITDIYAAREDNIYNISSQNLVDALNKIGKKAIYISDFNNISNYLKNHVHGDDIIITLGAGTITNLSKYLI